jgi:hypothetical protein
MTSPAQAPIVYVDVDDTLVRSFGTKRIPIAAVIERVRALRAAGFSLYCWSSGGAAYCREVATEVGLADCFVDFLPKPQFLIDDQHPSEWRALRWVHTNEAASMTPDEYSLQR